MILAIIWASCLFLIVTGCLGSITYCVRKVEHSKTERTAMEEGTKQKVVEATILERREHVVRLELEALNRQLEVGKSTMDWRTE